MASGRFEGKKVLVSGAGSGIGRSTAILFAREGADVSCADLNLEGARETVESIVAEGGSAFALACDISDVQAARDAVAASVDRLGALHVLCNVAGMAGFADSATMPTQDWNRFIGVNLNGTFFMSQAALPHLLEAEGGNIVNVASVAGLQGQAYCAAYCASKAGVVGLTKAMAVEYVKKGLRVNCVCPGAVQTPLVANFSIPEGADMEFVKRLFLTTNFAQPEEIAESIAYLASDAARSITGHALAIDDGVSIA